MFQYSQPCSFWICCCLLSRNHRCFCWLWCTFFSECLPHFAPVGVSLVYFLSLYAVSAMWIDVVVLGKCCFRTSQAFLSCFLCVSIVCVFFCFFALLHSQEALVSPSPWIRRASSQSNTRNRLWWSSVDLHTQHANPALSCSSSQSQMPLVGVGPAWTRIILAFSCVSVSSQERVSCSRSHSLCCLCLGVVFLSQKNTVWLCLSRMHTVSTRLCVCPAVPSWTNTFHNMKTSNNTYLEQKERHQILDSDTRWWKSRQNACLCRKKHVFSSFCFESDAYQPKNTNHNKA